MKKILLLPGATRSDYPDYQEVYETIAQGSRQKFPDKFDYLEVTYPGQFGVSSEQLSHASALNMALKVCRDFRPNWIVGFSVGGYVAMGALASQEEWCKEVEGVVVWGTSTKQSVEDYFEGSTEKKQQEIAKYLKRFTFLAPDFWDTFPDTKVLIAQVQCNIRLSCGEFDQVGVKRDDLETLAFIHQQSKQKYHSEVTEIKGLGHNVRKSKATASELEEYFDCLFNPFNYPC